MNDSKDKFEKTAELRQKILDYINEVGKVKSSEIVKKFNLRVDHSYRTLRKMESNGEVESRGKGVNVYFIPLQRVTTSAEEMRDKATHQIKVGKELKEQERQAEKRAEIARKNRPKWLTLNNDPNRKPITSQGGQGALRRGVFVKSSAEMI